jgi:hypothetical protein
LCFEKGEIMASKENESLTFHNENTLLQIALWSKVVGWALAVIYLLSWISDLVQMFTSGGIQLPPAIMDKFLYFANFIYPLAMGGFYFLVTHGIAQTLYIGLDLFDFSEEGEEE